jgi:regulator of protease activity HflC (stomatin/prohibitin superfamily)
MAEITGFGPFRHLRAESASHVLHYRGSALQRSGRAMSFWFASWSASLAEVPLDDREASMAFHGRTADFQDVLVQGSLTWRIVDPVQAAQRVDFSIDPRSGTHLKQPLESLGSALARIAQQHAVARVQAASLRELLAMGPEPLRLAIEQGLGGAGLLGDVGVELVAVRVEPVRPEAEIERALEAPIRERVQEEADEAAFRRRAQAVDKERAIQENELANQIELAKREAQLIDQRGANARREATEKAEADRIAVEAKAAHSGLESAARAQALTAVEGARLALDRERLEAQRTMPPEVLVALAAQELAAKLQRIEHLTITPDMLSPLLSALTSRAAAPEPARGGR